MSSDLPPGWVETTLGEIAETSLGKMLDRGKSTGDYLVPYLRNINVQWGRIDLDDVLTMDIPPEQRKFFQLQKGDLLVCEGGEIGRCAIWPGSAEYIAFQKALHRVRPYGGIDPKYLRYYIEQMAHSGGLSAFATGSTIKHLPQQQLRRLPIRLPPLSEQRRIVAVLEDHLSRLDAADSCLYKNLHRLKVLAKRVIVEAVPIPGPKHWGIATVADVGKVDLGRQRHPDWHNGPNMRPYLRVANVFEDRIVESDLMEMDFPPDVFERYLLREGDILLNEGQSPEYLGRPAMYRGCPPDVAFTNSLLRFRARSDVLPEWALLVFRRHMHAGRFIQELRITTNIAHLSASRLKKIEFPIPPVEEQRRIAEKVKDDLDSIERLSEVVNCGIRKSTALRQAIFFEAFSGHLVCSDPADEPAADALDRVARERGVDGALNRRRRRSSTLSVRKDTLL